MLSHQARVAWAKDTAALDAASALEKQALIQADDEALDSTDAEADTDAAPPSLIAGSGDGDGDGNGANSVVVGGFAAGPHQKPTSRSNSIAQPKTASRQASRTTWSAAGDGIGAGGGAAAIGSRTASLVVRRTEAFAARDRLYGMKFLAAIVIFVVVAVLNLMRGGEFGSTLLSEHNHF